jgi:hypothetical protein
VFSRQKLAKFEQESLLTGSGQAGTEAKTQQKRAVPRRRGPSWRRQSSRPSGRPDGRSERERRSFGRSGLPDGRAPNRNGFVPIGRAGLGNWESGGGG